MTPLPRIVGTTGYAQNGKDTVARLLGELGYERVGFADQLKDLALRIDPIVDQLHGNRLSTLVAVEGWEGAKKEPEVRRFLQELGNNAREVLGEDVWIGALAKRVQAYNPYTRLVISDVRYLNEGQWVRRMGGEVWRVTRVYTDECGTHPFENGVDRDHPSERDIPVMQADVELLNDGSLEAFERKVRKYAKERALIAAVNR